MKTSIKLSILFLLSGFFASAQGAITEGIKTVKAGDSFIITEGRYDSNDGTKGKLIAYTNNGKALKVEVKLEEIVLDTAKDGLGNQQISKLRFSFKDVQDYIVSGGSSGIFPTTLDFRMNNGFGTGGKTYLVDGAFVITSEAGYSKTLKKESVAISFILSRKKLAGLMKENTEDYTRYHDIVWNYIVNAKELEKKAIAEAEERERQRVAKEKKDNSLEGKKVKSIELVADGKNVGYGDAINVNVIATLKDGTVLKTRGIGGKTWLDDYIITSDAGSGPQSGSTVGNKNNTPNDAVKVTVQSKFHPELKDTKEIVLGFSSASVTVDVTEFLNINMCAAYSQPSGKDGNKGDCSKGQAAGDGSDGKNGLSGKDAGQPVEVKIGSFKHKKTGENVLSYEISCGALNKKFYRLPATGVLVFARGGCGQPGSDGGDGGEVKVTGVNTDCDCSTSAAYMGRGGNGGNGGNGGMGAAVTVIVDPSVTDYNLKTIVEGGSGGNAGRGGKSRAANTCGTSSASSIKNARQAKAGKDGTPGTKGMDGTVTKISQKVSVP